MCACKFCIDSDLVVYVCVLVQKRKERESAIMKNKKLNEEQREK